MNLHIRKMSQTDIADVQAIAMTSWHHTYDAIIPLEAQTEFLQQAYSEASLLYRLEHTHFFLAVIGKKVVGFANFSTVDLQGQVELGALYLLPSVIGKGIGTMLLEAGIKEISHIKEILVHVEKQNQLGTEFYQRKGFIYVKEFKEDFYGHTLENVQYILTL